MTQMRQCPPGLSCPPGCERCWLRGSDWLCGVMVRDPNAVQPDARPAESQEGER
jgi:hypothetical protein